jgi:predicted nicotinamide N-methyase
MPPPTKKRRRTPKPPAAVPERLVLFQDALQQQQQEAADDADDDLAIANVFFELANAPLVGYRLPLDGNRDSNKDVVVKVAQDSNAQAHTGGVVWETSYLLLEYLLRQHRQPQQAPPPSSPDAVQDTGSTTYGRVLEVGAGCGLLGTALALASDVATAVTVTEVDLVLPLLQATVARNADALSVSSCPLRACRLDWTDYEADTAAAGLAAGGMDTIVGTDVVFTPALVAPLWATLRYYSKASTVIYICLQVRCATSHAQLLATASDYGFRMRLLLRDDDDDDESRHIPSWGRALECQIYKITRFVIAASGGNDDNTCN